MYEAGFDVRKTSARKSGKIGRKQYAGETVTGAKSNKFIDRMDVLPQESRILMLPPMESLSMRLYLSNN